VTGASRPDVRGIVLLGPQFHEPTVGTVLEDLDLTGPVATITAGWQEWEAEDTALMRELGGHGVPLRLYERAERVWVADPELREGHRQMQTSLRTLRSLYNRQLERAGQVWVDLLALEEPPELIEPERRAALEHIQRLDAHLLARIRTIQADFHAHFRPWERPAVVRERREIVEALGRAETVVVEGGHVAVLLNRIRLFDVAPLLEDKFVIGCAGGAMALCARVVLFNDQPAIGRGHAEVALPGLGLAPGLVVLPDAAERLRTTDAERMRRLSLRVAPERCALLDPGARLYWNGTDWTGLLAHEVHLDGSVVEWGHAA
jgi:hypothetical protein